MGSISAVVCGTEHVRVISVASRRLYGSDSGDFPQIDTDEDEMRLMRRFTRPAIMADLIRLLCA